MGTSCRNIRFNGMNLLLIICHRFCDKTLNDTIEEFNKLIQKSSVEEYQERFEELKPFMLQQNPHLDESYFISSFISGLKEEIKHKVRAHEPCSLAAAYRQAKLHELSWEIENRRYKMSQRTFSPSPQNQVQKMRAPTTTMLQRNNQITTPNRQTLMEYKRSHNLCYKCGEKFAPGHQCKPRQLNLMEEAEEQAKLEEIEEEQNQEEELYQARDEVLENNLEISMNALTGNVGYNTLRI
ncbi:hypothetical protein GQ457_10G001980 [Hibiscus cannabinus]